MIKNLVRRVPPIPDLPQGMTRYAYRWDTAEPTAEQLASADTFFCRHPAQHIWSQAQFKKIDFGDAPEVAFLGRSNVGKSSILNALIDHKGMAYTSSKPGRTRLMNAFSINSNKLVLLDMPGYGHASRTEWGTQVMKYLRSRKQFRRAFVLIDASHGPKPADMMLLESLGREGISYQLVLAKIDKLKHAGACRKALEDTRHLMENEIGGGPRVLGEVLGTAADPAKKGARKVGISAVRWAVMAACGLGG